MTKFTKSLIFVTCCVICDRFVTSRPITVNPDFDYDRYSINNYNLEDDAARKPNAFFNRLPQNAYNDEADIANDDDVNYDDQQTDKPVTNLQYQQQQFDSNYLNNDNGVRKKKRRVRRPCIPIQSYGSNLFSNNRLKRQADDLQDQQDRESGKTLGLLGLLGAYGLGGGGGFGNPYQFGGNPYIGGGFAPQFGAGHFGGGAFGPQFGNQGGFGGFGGLGGQQFDSPLYNPVGGYPCIPMNIGSGQRPGAAFDSVNSGGNYPQTVNIYNQRPGLFGGGSHIPNYQNNNNQRPGSNNDFGGNNGGNNGGYNGGNNGGYNDNFNGNRPLFSPGSLTSTGKPLWEGIVDKVQEFITAMGNTPNTFLSSIGDSLQGVAASIQNASPVTSASNAVKTGYDEFKSLLFR